MNKDDDDDDNDDDDDDNTDQVNDAIREGKVPPKSKHPELVHRKVCTLHIFNHAITDLLAGVPATSTTEIQKSTLEKTTEFVNHLESQKSILCHASYTAHI